MKNDYHLRGSIFGILSIFLVLGGWTLLIGKFAGFAEVLISIPLWIGLLTCVFMGWILDKLKKNFRIFWGPVVFIPGAFTYCLIAYLFGAYVHPPTGYYASPLKSFFLGPFIYLVFFGGMMSILVAFIFQFFAKPGK